MHRIPSRIKLYLLRLGFQPNLKGYRLLARLIALAEEGEEVMPLKYRGYKLLAEEFGVGAAAMLLLSPSFGRMLRMPDRNNTNQPRSNSFRRFCTAET